MEREDSLRQELDLLKSRVVQLEEELVLLEARKNWPPKHFYGMYYALTGSVLGLIAGGASLLFNILGATLAGLHPLKLIQVYLTFPLGEQAETVNGGLLLTIGCCLYLLTGMVLGVPISLILNRYFGANSWFTRFLVVSVLSLALWGVGFYGILSWLQPALFGGNWILTDIPWYVGASTHLVFGWTLLLLQPFGQFMATTEEAEIA